MRHRLISLRALAIWLPLLTIIALAPAAPAQVRIPAAALPDTAQLNTALEHGQKLEREDRWGEALVHYEQALRNTPGHRELEERLALARIHYDLQRRYGDASFNETISQSPRHALLNAYSEVLLKIQSHYVEQPDWARLVRRGAQSLDVALSEEWFQRRRLPDVGDAEIESFRRYLASSVDAALVRNRHDARQFAETVAVAAQHRLGLPAQIPVCEFTCGALGALDAYSSFLTPDQFHEVMSQIEGNFVGLGIELKAEDQSLLIVHVIEGGPAEQAGVRAGDRITAVNGRTVADLSTDQAADMLKGPEGSTVDLNIASPGQGAARKAITRRRVEVPSVEGVRIIDAESGTGYARLTSFQKTTSNDLDAALWKLHGQGMRHLIVDVRGNPGGLLSASVDVADKFIHRGSIVSTRGRSQREDADYKAQAAGTWRVPLVVLVDGDSASASEIFAGAIRDHRRGVIVGERSFGKGSVQGIFPLNGSEAGIRLTTAKFFSPSGQAISKLGVSPDVAVRIAAKPAAADWRSRGDENQDAVLKAGIAVFREQVTSR